MVHHAGRLRRPVSVARGPAWRNTAPRVPRAWPSSPADRPLDGRGAGPPRRRPPVRQPLRLPVSPRERVHRGYHPIGVTPRPTSKLLTTDAQVPRIGVSTVRHRNSTTRPPRADAGDRWSRHPGRSGAAGPHRVSPVPTARPFRRRERHTRGRCGSATPGATPGAPVGTSSGWAGDRDGGTGRDRRPAVGTDQQFAVIPRADDPVALERVLVAAVGTEQRRLRSWRGLGVVGSRCSTGTRHTGCMDRRPITLFCHDR